LILGIVCGLICCALAASGGTVTVWGTTLMWALLWNRLLIGIVVFIIGAYNYHVFLKFRFYPWLRGMITGAFVSIEPAISSLMSPLGYKPEAVWGTIAMGALYGLVIDVVATLLAGDGKTLIGDWAR
jgi:hypothetical protein